MAQSTALTVIEDYDLPTSMYVGDIDPEEFEGVAIEFPRVKIPSGGALSFEVPNPDNPDDPMPEKTLEGVIVYHHTANAYWESRDTTNQPPDCVSHDGIWGSGDPGGECATCALNKFGSGEGGKGKACKNMKQVYLLRKTEAIPLLLSLPPTSLKGFQAYMGSLRIAMRNPSSVITQIGLKRMEAGGNSFSVATFRNVGALSPELALGSKHYATELKAMIKNALLPPEPEAVPGETPLQPAEDVFTATELY